MNSVPSVLNNQPLQNTTDMNIISDILYPINVSQKSAKFVLENKGILDSNSRLQFKLTHKTSSTSAGATQKVVTGGSPQTFATDTWESAGSCEPVRVGPATSTAIATTSTTSLVISTAHALLLKNAGVKVEDKVYNITRTLPSVITAISDDFETITVAPAIAGQVDTDTFAVYSSSKIKITNLDADATIIEDKRVILAYQNGTKVGSDADAQHSSLISKWDNTSKIATMKVNDDTTGFILLAGTQKVFLVNNSSLILSATDQAKIVADGDLNGTEFYFTADDQAKPSGLNATYKVIGSFIAKAGNTMPTLVKLVDGNSVIRLSATLKSVHFKQEMSTIAENDNDYAILTGGTNPPTFFPFSTGCASAIKKCYLEIGGRRISSNEAVADWKTLRNLQASNEFRDNVMRYFEGTFDRLAPSFQNPSATGVASTNGGLLGLLHKEIPEGQTISDQALTSPFFSIKLSDLIPMLRGVRLPLFAIKQEVSIFIEWTEDIEGERALQELSKDHNYTGTEFVTDEVLMMVDYLFWEEEQAEIMNEMVSNTGWSLPYEDIILINATLPAGAGEKTQNTLLYLGGQKVRAIVVQKKDNGAVADNVSNNMLEGKYISRGLQKVEGWNLEINNTPIYSQDLELTGLKFNELARIYNNRLHINSNRYSLVNQVDDAGDLTRATDTNFSNFHFVTKPLVSGTGTPISAIAGNQNWVGFDLSDAQGDGSVMSNLPLVLKHKVNKTTQNNENTCVITYNIFAIVNKYLSINNGYINLMD